MLLDSGHLSNYSYSQKVLNYLTLILNEGHSLYVQTAVFNWSEITDSRGTILVAKVTKFQVSSFIPFR